ncbi:hypothetical protein PS6_000605 [Mucor atramentarius]
MVHQDTYWSQLSASMVDKIVGQEFQLLEVLGHGAYGCLFLGQSLKDNSYVAVKVLTKSGLDLQQLQLQQLEIDIQTSLKHPNLLALHRVIQDADYIYMVMELCDQGDLFDYVIRDQDENSIREEHILENILLKCEDDEDEEDVTCKVADFGLATRERYSMEFGCGSTSYLAPEHFDDDKQAELVPYDAAASDSWSLGVLLLALMFGRNPWQEASSADPAFSEFKRVPSMLKEQLFPELSTATYRLLESILAIDGADRPSVSEIKEQFLAIDRLYVDEEDDYYVDDNKKESPVSIPTASTKHSDITSFDSAFFSGGTGSSWSDMVEEDEEAALSKSIDFDSNHKHQHHYAQYDDEDTDMFVHSGEKESWWL